MLVNEDDNGRLPELSFGDFIDISPRKKADSDNELLQFSGEDDVVNTKNEDTLNTPGPKPKHKLEETSTTTTPAIMSDLERETCNIDDMIDEIDDTNIESELVATKIPTISQTPSPATVVGATKPLITKLPIINTKPIGQVKNNLENFFGKDNAVNVPTSSSIVRQVVRIAHKMVVSTAPSTTTSTVAPVNSITKITTSNLTSHSNTNTIVKTAVKTADGKIFYIQKAPTGSLPMVRLQPKSAAAMASATTTSTTTSTAKVPTAGGTLINSNNNKTVTLVRTADGKLVPITHKFPTSVAGTKAIIPTVAKLVSGPKSGQLIVKTSNSTPATTTITSSGTLSSTIQCMSNVIKQPIQIMTVPKPTTTTTTTSTTTEVAATTTTCTDSTKTTTTTPKLATSVEEGSKYIVKNSSGSPIVLSNQKIIKLTGKPTMSSTTTPTSSTLLSGNINKLKAVQITGKPGIKYVHVVPASNSKTTTTTTTSTTLTTTTTTTTTASTTKATSVPVVRTVVVRKSLPSTATTTATPKMAYIRPPIAIGATNGTKVAINKPTTIQTNKIQKPSGDPLEIRDNLPTLNKFFGRQTATTTNTTTSISLTNNKAIACKPNSNDFNADFKRFTSTLKAGLEPESKKMRLGSLGAMPPARNRTTLSSRGDYIQYHSDAKDGKDDSPRTQMFGSTLATMNIELLSKNKDKEIERVKQQIQQQAQVKSSKSRGNKSRTEDLDAKESGSIIEASNSTVLVRRKHCNCSKSQCMKLYCDCFANGEFCQDCTCRDCKNNLENDDERQRAIQICLERNPTAFQPKITTCLAVADTSMRHNKGCNCKRSNCLKNYCECYEAKIPCSSNCKCVGCRNGEDSLDLNMDPVDPTIMETIKGKPSNALKPGQKRSYTKRGELQASPSEIEQPTTSKRATTEDKPENELEIVDNADSRQMGNDTKRVNFITSDVIGATVQCLISQAEQCVRAGLEDVVIEKIVLQELGRCLAEIIDFSIRNTNISFSQD